jgi:hypothetical protein
VERIRHLFIANKELVIITENNLIYKNSDSLHVKRNIAESFHKRFDKNDYINIESPLVEKYYLKEGVLYYWQIESTFNPIVKESEEELTKYLNYII